MSVEKWDKAKEYLIFYAEGEKIIPRRDIRNQLYDSVETGDGLVAENQRLYETYQMCDNSRREMFQKLEAIRTLCDDYHPSKIKRDGRKNLRLAILEVLGVE